MGTANLDKSGARRGYPHASEKVQITRWMARPADSYGLVLLLVILNYVTVSTTSGAGWANVAIFILQGLTLLFALHTSRARRFWVLLAAIYLVAGTALASLTMLVPGGQHVSDGISVLGGVLVLVTPVVIVRRIATHRVVTAETLLGAICVYVLIGFSFSSLFMAVAYVSPAPFFTGVQHAAGSAFLFFSYMTLTTVGYGNLVPASSLGQSLAMIEAMAGQVYLVIVVSRLVSLWGQSLPRNTRTHDATDDDA